MKLRLISTTLLLSSLCIAGSPENRINELQNIFKDTYEFEQRRRELREENRRSSGCNQPTEQLSYYQIAFINNLSDIADGKTTTATIWNPNRELCDWELIQDDKWTLVEKRYNEWDRLQWQEKKDFVKIWAYGTTALTAAIVVSSYMSKN